MVACSWLGSEGVGWAGDAPAGRGTQNVGVDHRRLHILVAEQFVDCPDVVASHQQVSGKAVADAELGSHSIHQAPVAPGCGCGERFDVTHVGVKGGKTRIDPLSSS
jgi:hypothetical protein